MTETLNIARLRERLAYDPSTGVFTWRTAPTKRPDLVGRVAGGPVSHGYVTIHLDGRHYPADRLAWAYVYGEWPAGEVDHRNRLRADNRVANLRVATHQQNTCNVSLRARSRSGKVGVAVDTQTQKWRAHITVNGKMKSLGRFTDKAEAIEARKRAETIYFGEFAST